MGKKMASIAPSLDLTPSQISALKQFGVLLSESQTPSRKKTKSSKSDDSSNTFNVTSFFDKTLMECFDTSITGKLEVGDKIFLHGEDNIPKSIYAYLGHDEETDSFILRKLSEEGEYFTIPQFICNSLNIEYHPKNVLASSKLKWKLYIPDFETNQEFNPTDLSTYPTMEGKITCIGVKIEGIKNQDAETFILPDGTSMKKMYFWDKFYIKAKMQLGQYNSKNVNQKIDYIKVTSLVGKFNVANDERKKNSIFNTSTDEDGNVWILLDLRRFNLTPNDLRGHSVNDLFEFGFPKADKKQAEYQAKVRQFYQDLLTFHPSAESRIIPKMGELLQPSAFGELFKPSTSWTEVEAKDVTTSMIQSGQLIRTLDGNTYEVYRGGRWVVTDVKPSQE